MKINIYSLKRILYEGDAISVNCRTTSGEITVLDNHRPLISVLAAGTMKVTSPDGEKFFPVREGFIEVKNNNEVRCIVEE